MSYFPSPIQVTAQPASCTVRVSVRASESRIDEWSIEAEDVWSVLSWPLKDGWRGEGNLRILVGRSGGSVAFHAASGDRAIMRASNGIIESFLAHLHAAYTELPTLPMEIHENRPGTHRRDDKTKETNDSHNTDNVKESNKIAEALAQLQLQIKQGNEAIFEALRRIEEKQSASSQTEQVIRYGADERQLTDDFSLPPTPVFVPSLATALDGTTLQVDEKTGEADVLTEAAAALKAAKQKTSTETPT